MDDDEPYLNLNQITSVLPLLQGKDLTEDRNVYKCGQLMLVF